jgi:hypothetical protein
MGHDDARFRGSRAEDAWLLTLQGTMPSYCAEFRWRQEIA